MYTELKNLRLPGFAWVAILVGIVGAMHTFFPNAIWYDAALVLLAGVAKALDINFERVIAIVEEFSVDHAGGTPRAMVTRTDVVGEVEEGTTGKAIRWLFG